MEEHENLRKDIQAALADIPRKLNNVHRLSDVHVQSLALHSCADSVFLSIFIVLERIINKLSMSFTGKQFVSLGRLLIILAISGSSDPMQGK